MHAVPFYGQLQPMPHRFSAKIKSDCWPEIEARHKIEIRFSIIEFNP